MPGDTALGRLLLAPRVLRVGTRRAHRPGPRAGVRGADGDVPANERSVLLWGDGRPATSSTATSTGRGARLGDGRVGPPEVDVAWATFFQRFFAQWPSSGACLGPGDVRARRDGGDVRATRRRGARRSRLVRSARGLPLRDHPRPDEPARHRVRGCSEAPADPDDLVMFAPLLKPLSRGDIDPRPESHAETGLWVSWGAGRPRGIRGGGALPVLEQRERPVLGDPPAVVLVPAVHVGHALGFAW